MTLLLPVGKGSLIAFLRKQLWALNLTAGNAGDGFEQNSTYSIFSISIILTKSGFQNVDKVLETVFAYLHMLKEARPNQRIYEEIQKIENLEFEFGEEAQPSDNVEGNTSEFRSERSQRTVCSF